MKVIKGAKSIPFYLNLNFKEISKAEAANFLHVDLNSSTLEMVDVTIYSLTKNGRFRSKTVQRKAKNIIYYVNEESYGYDCSSSYSIQMVGEVELTGDEEAIFKLKEAKDEEATRKQEEKNSIKEKEQLEKLLKKYPKVAKEVLKKVK